MDLGREEAVKHVECLAIIIRGGLQEWMISVLMKRMTESAVERGAGIANGQPVKCSTAINA